MFEWEKWPVVVVIGIGETGRSIISRLLEDFPKLNYLIINDDSEVSEIEQENKVYDFLSSKSSENKMLAYIVGMIDETPNTSFILSSIADMTKTIEFLPMVFLTTRLEFNDEHYLEKIKKMIPITFVVKNCELNNIYNVVFNLLVKTCSPKRPILIDIDIYDIETSLLCANNHYISFGSGMGIDKTKYSIMRAMQDLLNEVDLSKIKRIIFIFKLPMHTGIYEVKDATNMIIKKFPDRNFGFTVFCLTDDKLSKEQSEVTILATSD
jgi:cell division GTPase FtsZ